MAETIADLKRKRDEDEANYNRLQQIAMDSRKDYGDALREAKRLKDLRDEEEALDNPNQERLKELNSEYTSARRLAEEKRQEYHADRDEMWDARDKLQASDDLYNKAISENNKSDENNKSEADEKYPIAPLEEDLAKVEDPENVLPEVTVKPEKKDPEIANKKHPFVAFSVNENDSPNPIIPSDSREKFNPVKTTNDRANVLKFDIPKWSVSDFIIERSNWQKSITSISGEPGWFYFKLFFNFNTGNGLLGNIINEDYFGGNSALKYLLTTHEYYPTEKLLDRATALIKFVCLLSYINCQAPWFFKSITGLQKANEIYISDFGKDKSLEIGCSEESVDMRLNLLMDLYRYCAFDDINCKEILPENLRKFDMTVLVFNTPLKYYQTAIGVAGNKSYDYKSFVGESGDFSNALSYKMYTFHNCEFLNSSQMMANSLNNEKPNQLGKQSIVIKYDRVYKHNMNEWNDIMFGSDGIHYNPTQSGTGLMKEHTIGNSKERFNDLAKALDINNINMYNPSAKQYKYIVDLTEYFVGDSMLDQGGSLGNLYGYYGDVDKNYFLNKISRLKDGIVTGNLYNYKLGPGTKYNDNKNNAIKNGSVRGNIYNYDLGPDTKYFENKLDEIKGNGIQYRYYKGTIIGLNDDSNVYSDKAIEKYGRPYPESYKAHYTDMLMHIDNYAPLDLYTNNINAFDQLTTSIKNFSFKGFLKGVLNI